MSEVAEVVFWVAAGMAGLSYLGHAAWRAWFMRKFSEFICVECGAQFAEAPGGACPDCAEGAKPVIG